VTRLFEKEYGLPVNSNPTDPRSRVRTFRMAALFSDHRFTSAQIALLEQVRWSNAYVRATMMYNGAHSGRPKWKPRTNNICLIHPQLKVGYADQRQEPEIPPCSPSRCSHLTLSLSSCAASSPKKCSNEAYHY
jgi:hypothetical protein